MRRRTPVTVRVNPVTYRDVSADDVHRYRVLDSELVAAGLAPRDDEYLARMKTGLGYDTVGVFRVRLADRFARAREGAS